MNDRYDDAKKIISAFYSHNAHTEEEEFLFVEAMQYMIEHSSTPDIAMYNLASYYLDIKNFELEKKYFEMSLAEGNSLASQPLGYIWYYGQTGEVNYEKAYNYFKICADKGFMQSQYKIADMYKNGFYVKQDYGKYIDMIDALYQRAVQSKDVALSVPFPEIAYRRAMIFFENKLDTIDDLDSLIEARDYLTLREGQNHFWGNIGTMEKIIIAINALTGEQTDFIDLYDLLGYYFGEAKITFHFDKEYAINIFPGENEEIYDFEGKWYHGVKDFLESAMIGDMYITSLYNKITNIHVWQH